MASARKPFNPKGKAPSLAHLFAAFIADLLLGDVRATALHVVDQGNGRKRLEYDDPNGEGQARIARNDR